MADLSEFTAQPQQPTTLSEDFATGVQASPAISEASAKQVAAYTAALTPPAQMTNTYSQVKTDLAAGDNTTSNQIISQWDQNNASANQKALYNLASNPDVPENIRRSAIVGFPKTNSANTYASRVGKQALIANSEPTDNDENEMIRVNTDQALDQVDAYNGWLQKKLNEINNSSQPDMLNAMGQMVEQYLPFFNASASAKVSGQLLGTDGNYNPQAVLQGFTLMGENINQMREAYQALPYDQRQQFAQHMMTLVNQTSGPNAFDANNITQMQLLNDVLTNGGYNRDQRLADNIFSLLDDSIIAGPIAKLLGGAGDALRGIKGGASAATEARYTNAVRALNEGGAATEAQGVADSAVAQSVPPANVDDVVGAIHAFDGANSSTIANDRALIQQHLANPGSDIEDVIDQMKSLDNAPKAQIDQARSVLQQVEATGSANIPQQTIDGTKDLISDNIINRLSQLDNAPSETYSAIRDAVSKRVDSEGVGSKTIGQNVINDVNSILSDKQLDLIDTKTAGQIKSYTTQAVQESNVRRRAARSGVQPTSISQTYKDTNPMMARAANDAVTVDTSGNAADILYGTTRADAIGNDTLPEIATQVGSVRNKVVIDESKPTPDAAVVKDINQGYVANQFTQSEKASMRTQVADQWRDVHGLFPRHEMSMIEPTATGSRISMVYGPKDGAFSDPSQAIAQAKFGLKQFGVNDKDITILAKSPTGEFVPTTETSKPGAYLIKVNKDYTFSPDDLNDWEFLHSAPKLRNIYSPNPGKLSALNQGTIGEHLIPSTAIVNEHLLIGATRAADRSASVEERFFRQAMTDYANKYKKLSGDQKYLVENYIRLANAKSLKFDTNFLRSMGMNDDAIDTVRGWKSVWDTQHYFENADLNKTLRARGYQMFVDQTGHSELLVRPVDIRQTNGVHEAFDGSRIVSLQRSDIAQIYERGGTLATTRGSIPLDDREFTHVIVDNHDSGTYLRTISDDHPTLRYRDGYYQIKYEHPYYLTKEDATGTPRAFATAPDVTTAKQMLARLRTTDQQGRYDFHPDLKTNKDGFGDDEWNVMVAQGRTAQRARGKLLADASETASDYNMLHVQPPEESLINSIRSMATRVAHRDWLDTSKERFMKQFGHLVPNDPETFTKAFPNDPRMIGRNMGDVDHAELMDARATWHYIDKIDGGYTNLLDEISKNFFKSMAETAGRQGWGHIEKAARAAGKFGPNSYARSKAFRLLLAANPLRQLPLQAMQAVPVILGTNPTGIPRIAARFALMNYVARGGDVESMWRSGAQALMGMTKAEAEQMVKHFHISGFEQAAKASVYIRDDGKSLVDKNFFQRFRNLAATPINLGQKFGFETGENALMKSVWLSEYDKALKAGKVTDEVADKVAAKTRFLTGDMNKAGQMPYNSNSLSALMQFFQMPHKIFSQIMFNHRGLTGAERMRLGAAYVLTYGIGAGPLMDLIGSQLPDNSPIKETIRNGLFDMALNKTLGTLFNGGKDTEVNASNSWRQLDQPDFYMFFKQIMGMQLGEVFTNSPSASLVFGDNPRITRFVQALARPFTVKDKPANELIDVGTSFLNLFPGLSSFAKAKYILENQKIINASGAVVDDRAGYAEGWAKLAGLQTMNEVKRLAFNEKQYMNSDKYKFDIDYFLTTTSQRLANRGISNDTSAYYVDMLSEAQKIYGNNPYYLKEIEANIDQRMLKGDYTLFNTLMKDAEYMSPNDMESLLNNAPNTITEDQKNTIREAIAMFNRKE